MRSAPTAIRECLDSFVAGFIQLHRSFEILYRLFEKLNEADALRAVVLRDGRLEVRETPDPAPGPGELLLRTLSTAICASDVHFMDHPELAVDDPTGRSLYDTDRDVVLGHEFVGEVIGHGPGCTDQFAVGLRVTAMPVRLVNGGAGGMRIIGQHPAAQGSFGELLVVSEAAAKSVPGDVSSDAIALTDAFAVGEFYVRSAQIQPGEIAIVIGAGAIGLSAVAALAGRGIEPIIVADYKPDRRELARDRFGAHVVVDPAEKSAFDAFREVRAQRGLPGPAVVFECVGAAGSSRRSSNRPRWPPGSIARAAGTPVTCSTSPPPLAKASQCNSAGVRTRRTGTEPSTPSRRDGWIRHRAWARSSA